MQAGKGVGMLFEMISVIVGILITWIYMGGGMNVQLLSYFIDLPSLICILVFCIPVLLRNGLWKDFIRAIKLLRKTYVCRLSELKRTLDVVELMQKQVLYAGIICTIAPFIFVSRRIDEPAVLGINISVVLIVVLYTAILELLLLPLQVEVKRRIIDYMEEE